MDLEKAFDSIWTKGLIPKLIKLKFPIYLINIFQLVNYNSTVRAVPAEVPQGSLLGPKLFDIYNHDLPIYPAIIILTYADDIAIYATSSYNNCSKITNIQNKWKLNSSDSKKESILLSK